MLSVLKIGGSVLRDDESYRSAAHYLRVRITTRPDERLVVIVSARHGVTDELLDAARRAGGEPNPDPVALDLLWSTGEIASVATLALALHREHVHAIPLNVHQTGLHVDEGPLRAGVANVRPLRLLAAIASAPIVVVPGFLGISAGGGIASLGRGGSDLTAVLLAIALGAEGCELVKDVAGYFTADPHVDPFAHHIHTLPIDRAMAMAAEGCDLVQPAALDAACSADLPITVRSLDPAAPVTYVQPRSAAHGICHEDDPRRAAVGA
jgi:aspartate kinase